MNTEDYVSLEVAKLLKEKGYCLPCDSFYTLEGFIKFRSIADNFNRLTAYSRPTLYEAQKWLHVALFMDTVGLLLLGIGLFSSQWVCFLIVLAMSFSQTQKLGAWAVFLDSLVTVIVYAFAILNAYHLA